MPRYFAGIVTGIAAMAGGGWLIAAPFALGYQSGQAGWADATKVDVFTGIGILALGLVAVLCFAAGLVTALRAEGALAPRGAAKHAEADAGRDRGPAEEDRPIELQTLVARLALALEERTGEQPRRAS
jgi:hypothetical protein